VGIIIVCDFFRLKPTAAPEREVCVELQRDDRAATLLLKKNRTNFQNTLCIFYTIMYYKLDPMGEIFLEKYFLINNVKWF